MSKFKRLIKLVNWYPPHWIMGIRVIERSTDYRRFVVRLKMSWYNRNAFGTHWGGALYSMCDAWFAFIVLMNLGQDYVVWDSAAKIQFKKATKKEVRAVFELSQDRLEEIRQEVDREGKMKYWFQAEVKDKEGNVVAIVDKEVYVRKK